MPVCVQSSNKTLSRFPVHEIFSTRQGEVQSCLALQESTSIVIGFNSHDNIVIIIIIIIVRVT